MKKIVYAIFALSMFVACDKEQSSNRVNCSVVDPVMDDSAPVTKTTVTEAGSIMWNPGDQISLFNGTSRTDGGDKFTSTIPAGGAPQSNSNFQGSVSFLYGSMDGVFSFDFVGVYPYSESNTFDAESNTFTVNMPKIQNAIAGSYSEGSLLTAAKSPDFHLQYRHICSMARIYFSRNDVKSVTIRNIDGNPIAGTFNVAFEYDSEKGEDIPVIKEITNGSSTITLNAPDNGTFASGIFYYLPLSPVVMSQGVAFDMTLSDGRTGTRTFANANLTFHRGLYKNVKNVDATVVFE